MAKAIPICGSIIRLVRCDRHGRIFWTTDAGSDRCGMELNQITTENGYKKVSVAGRRLLVHRLIWILLNGTEPETIDHINGNRSDNRPENLRPATIAQNQWNMMPRGGKSRFKGVYSARGGKWGSRIKVGGKTKHLGTYDKERDAAKAYDEAAADLHGVYAKTNLDLGLL